MERIPPNMRCFQEMSTAIQSLFKANPIPARRSSTRHPTQTPTQPQLTTPTATLLVTEGRPAMFGNPIILLGKDFILRQFMDVPRPILTIVTKTPI